MEEERVSFATLDDKALDLVAEYLGEPDTSQPETVVTVRFQQLVSIAQAGGEPIIVSKRKQKTSKRKQAKTI